MNKIELLRLALLTLEQAESKGNCEYEATGLIRAALAQPELNARELAKVHRSAWKNVRSEYKDDPECCFALGFDAGYDAVARMVEPPVSESGAGFESLSASPIAQPELEPIAAVGEAVRVITKLSYNRQLSKEDRADCNAVLRIINRSFDARENESGEVRAGIEGIAGDAVHCSRHCRGYGTAYCHCAELDARA